ncbi:MAG: hypothetical protein Q9157_001673 [Trypethelium eluteriae]
MVSAVSRGLYDGSRQKRFSKPLRRYNNLSESEISLLTRVLSNAPSQNLLRTSPRYETYVNITQEMIQALPSVLTTPPPTKHLFGLFTTDNNQCMVKDPRRIDGRPFRGLCDMHSRLQCPLTHSILRFVLDEITCYMPRLFELPFEPECQSLFEVLINVTSLYLRPVDFEKLWGRPPSQGWERQKNRCAACILARIGSDADVLVGLSAVYRARVREETYDFHLRASWYDEWIRAHAGHDGENLVEKSHALGSVMKRVVRKARKKKEALSEIDPDASWARKMPAAGQSSGSRGPGWPQRGHSVASGLEKVACNHSSKSSSFSDEETSAILGGTSIPPRILGAKPSDGPAFTAQASRHYFSSCSGSTALEDDNYMEIDNDGVSEEAHTGCVRIQQPTYKIPSAAKYAYSVNGSIVEDPTRSSTGPKQSTPRASSTASDLADWVDMCAYMNRTPSPATDGPEPSESGISHMFGTSTRVDGIPATTLNKSTNLAILDYDDDVPETPKAVPQIQFSPVPPLEKKLPLTPDTAEQLQAQVLRPKPSVETVASGSVYSFYEGPYGERYTTPLPPPPKPLHIQKASNGLPARPGVPRVDSAMPSPPPTNPAFQMQSIASGMAPAV